jgi:GNAT superfamily N-acetyltransferase
MAVNGLTSTVRWETSLTEPDHAALSELLVAAFPEQPDVFVGRSWAWARKEARLWLADSTGRPVAHLAVERRLIDVGGTEVLVAGIGEVAVSPELQGRGLGAVLMDEFRGRLQTEFAGDYGFVQCGEQVLGFYRSAGWTPVPNVVRHLDPGDERTVREGVWPALVMAGQRPLTEWPDGLVDLRGLPW